MAAPGEIGGVVVVFEAVVVGQDRGRTKSRSTHSLAQGIWLGISVSSRGWGGGGGSIWT